MVTVVVDWIGQRFPLDAGMLHLERIPIEGTGCGWGIAFKPFGSSKSLLLRTGAKASLCFPSQADAAEWLRKVVTHRHCYKDAEGRSVSEMMVLRSIYPAWASSREMAATTSWLSETPC